MKLIRLLPSLLVGFFSVAAFAHPGGNTLTCKTSLPQAGAQNVQFKLTRSNGTGWYKPDFTLNVDGKNIPLKTTTERHAYGETVHNSPLGLIHVTAQREAKPVSYYITVDAIPSTVKAFDTDGKPVKWSLEDQKNADGCYDSNGKASFQGLFESHVFSPDGEVNIQGLQMDCELEYDSGMAC